MFLISLRKKRTGRGYPFSVPVIKNLDSLPFSAPVTVLSGENGSGKSTVLEIAASLCNAQRIGDGRIDDTSARAVQKEEDSFGVVFRRRPKRSFYFSAESFVRYLSWIEQTRVEAEEAIKEINARFSDPGAAALACQPHRETLQDLAALYACELTASSHGEGFLAFFRSRLKEKGLYLIDEPEGALSYYNQYILAVLIRDAALEMDCQFIIATHSPVLTAIPSAALLELKNGEIAPTTYDGLENNSFLQLFLKRKDTML